ncbi:hypothetical protein DUNSADRAFT_5909 [Dunaliella salina]|uniref:Encoded protein n=1 Tax=Dunaliella salina TaxID=3046 RepID=A0ABQ7GPD3_DUNSA|nr:hypothetical protein DUNSADRAFT_5909 [Dunaliella salina]|eukprot:KAF5836462.1 hypothetical protein DUNSADRAFT_5909 [Dunaliella salina]
MPSRFGPRLASVLTSAAHPKCNLEALANSHPINSTIQLLMPSGSCGNAPPLNQASMRAHQDNVADEAAYMLATVRLGDLVAELVAYNQQHLHPLQFQAVALGPSLDRHGGVAFTPDGMLHLAVLQDMFQQLGLPGKTSPTHSGARYNISIKLNAKGFKAGRTFHDKVVDSLNTRVGPCTLAMAWSDPPSGQADSRGGAAPCPTTCEGDTMHDGDAAAHSNPSTMQDEYAAAGSNPSTMQDEDAAARSNPSCPAPSHGLSSVLRAQGRFCVAPLQHKQWGVSPVRVPLLHRQLFVQPEAVSGDGGGEGGHTGSSRRGRGRKRRRSALQSDARQGRQGHEEDGTQAGCVVQGGSLQGGLHKDMEVDEQGGGSHHAGTTSPDTISPGVEHQGGMLAAEQHGGDAAAPHQHQLLQPQPQRCDEHMSEATCAPGCHSGDPVHVQGCGDVHQGQAQQLLHGVGARHSRDESIKLEQQGLGGTGGVLKGHVVRDVHQWLGALACNLPGQACDRLLPKDVSSSSASCHAVHVQQWSGLIPSKQVHQQILKAQEAVALGHAPWAAVGVQGWQDSPVAWLGMEHTSSHNMGLGGSQSCYIVLLLPGRDVLVLRGLGAGDAPE